MKTAYDILEDVNEDFLHCLLLTPNSLRIFAPYSYSIPANDKEDEDFVAEYDDRKHAAKALEDLKCADLVVVHITNRHQSVGWFTCIMEEGKVQISDYDKGGERFVTACAEYAADKANGTTTSNAQWNSKGTCYGS
tara:strand:+ start:18566 stop:18973 length:408 start_codon:yes stop_codon:yes gene_type:complete